MSRRFRQVVPVVLGHLLPHRATVETGRIEDVRVVGAPELLQLVVARGGAPHRARGEPQPLSVPVGASVGGEDRPAHRGKATDEERRRRFEHRVRRLEPGDVRRLFVPRRADGPEPDERFHLVRRPAHRAGHEQQRVDVGVGHDRQEPRLARGVPPERPVQRGPPGAGPDGTRPFAPASRNRRETRGSSAGPRLELTG